MLRVHAQRSPWLGAGIALLLAIAQLRLIVMLFKTDYGRSIQAARGVVEGRPHWRVFQNRVLGPYAAEALSAVFPSYTVAHVVLSIGVIAAAGFCAFRMGERAGGPRAAWLALAVLHLGFALLLANPAGTPSFIYIWDFFDLLVFLLFVAFVAARRPWPWFAALAAVGVLNHEIAVFIAIWLAVDSVARWLLGKRGVIAPQPLDGARIAAGATVAVLAMLIVEWLRTALLVEEIGPALFGGTARTSGASFHFALGDNLHTLRALCSQLAYSVPQLVPLYVIGAAVLAVAIARRNPGRFLGLAVTYLGLIAALLVFGLLLETRIYVVLVPLFVLGSVLLTAEPPGADG